MIKMEWNIKNVKITVKHLLRNPILVLNNP